MIVSVFLSYFLMDVVSEFSTDPKRGGSVAQLTAAGYCTEDYLWVPEGETWMAC